jgi:hypothetical protein
LELDAARAVARERRAGERLEPPARAGVEQLRHVDDGAGEGGDGEEGVGEGGERREGERQDD